MMPMGPERGATPSAGDPAPSAFDVPHRVAEVFKAESGRVLAGLIRILRNFEAAEDVVQEAFAIALTEWPKGGMPDNPGAWLRTTAKNRAVDRLRRARTRREKAGDLKTTEELRALERFAEPDPEVIRDDQLRLIFTCCHPGLNKEAQLALTLRTLGGLSTPEIARAFLVPEATMAQRIVRAKRKIEGAGIPFVVPPKAKLPERLDSILAVLYLIFNEGYSASSGDRLVRRGLVQDGIRLGATLAELLPEVPEVLGLLALMLLHDARSETRTDSRGEIVLLRDQDRRRWDVEGIDRGRALLERAMALGAPGPYQIQAAISALHATAPSSEETDWLQIAALYGALMRHTPTPVVALNRAVAVAMAEGPEAGLALLAPLGEEARMQAYHLYHSARADLLRRAGRPSEALEAYRLALSLAQTDSEQAFLKGKIAELSGER